MQLPPQNINIIKNGSKNPRIGSFFHWKEKSLFLQDLKYLIPKRKKTNNNKKKGNKP